MTKKPFKKKSASPRFVPFDRLDTTPRMVVAHLCGHELLKVMKSDRSNGLEWSGLEGAAGTRYMKSLTHGVHLDHSALKAHQITAVQTIFTVVCYFEQERALSDLCLPGMEKEFYGEMLDVDPFINECAKTLQAARQNQVSSAELDSLMSLMLYKWRCNEHHQEVVLRLAEKAAAESSESTEKEAASEQATVEAEVVTDENVEEDQSNVISLFRPQATG